MVCVRSAEACAASQHVGLLRQQSAEVFKLSAAGSALSKRPETSSHLWLGETDLHVQYTKCAVDRSAPLSAL